MLKHACKRREVQNLKKFVRVRTQHTNGPEIGKLHTELEVNRNAQRLNRTTKKFLTIYLR